MSADPFVLGRVFVVKDQSLPLDFRASIAGRAQWLRRELPAIDAELGLTYQPIEIIPACWLIKLDDGTVGPVPGRVIPHPRGEAHVFVVQLTAPTLLLYEDDLIRGVLAHEFQHVAYETLRVFEHGRAAGSGTVHIKKNTPDYLQNWKTHRRLDAAVQVSRQGWLGDRLSKCVARVEDDDDVGLQRCIRALQTEWGDLGLPIELPDLNYHVNGLFAIDDAIVKRAKKLKEQ